MVGTSERRVRVVIADDDATMRFLLSTILSLEQDFELVAEALDGVQAVELASAPGVDVLVLDLSMPRLDGLEVLRELQRAGASVRVVVLSGLNIEEVEQKARALGAADFMVKGIDPAELVRRLRAMVSPR